MFGIVFTNHCNCGKYSCLKECAYKVVGPFKTEEEAKEYSKRWFTDWHYDNNKDPEIQIVKMKKPKINKN
jgi:hypothetical protein